MSIQSRADARSRSLRTVAQGLVSVVLVAAAGVIVDQVTPGELIDWATLGTAVATAAGTAVAAYVHRVLGGDPSPSDPQE